MILPVSYDKNNFLQKHRRFVKKHYFQTKNLLNMSPNFASLLHRCGLGLHLFLEGALHAHDFGRKILGIFSFCCY
jgi:hypothetical protein